MIYIYIYIYLPVFFWIGRNRYTKNIPERNIVILFFKCSWVCILGESSSFTWFKLQHALIRRKYKSRQQHWLDVANDRYDQQTINEFKAVYNVGVLFLFYPMYWALYDQQGSRWTIQAMRMNGFTWGWQILPDQVQVINPVLILLFIPLFDKVLYPLLGKIYLCTICK